MRRSALAIRRTGAAAILLALAACGPATDETGTAGGGARTYEVRGVLESLPAEAGGQLRVRHEEIPDLVGAGGEVEGMAAMTMPFPVDAAVDLDGFAAGDVVRFTLTVDWEAARPVAITAIERLPADTELTLD